MCTIEQICENAEVGDEKCCLLLENMYTWIWFDLSISASSNVLCQVHCLQ